MASTTTGLTAALLYTRVSTEDQADAEALAALGKTAKKSDRNGLSLGTQLTEGRRYVSFQHDWVIQGEYQDIMSGRRDDRPGYLALLAEAKRLRAQGRRVVIVVAALDRLGRDIHERVRIWKDLSPEGVEFHSCRDGGLVSEFTFNILASVAREEVRRLGERVTAVRTGLRNGGWKPPGRVAFGYTWRPATDDERRQGAPASVLVPDPATASAVREAFERAAGGASTASVARWLSSLPAETRGKRTASPHAVQLLLRAPVYVGRPDDGDEDVLARPLGRWEPLVSDETYAAVQEGRERHKYMPRQASKRYLVTGLVRCSRCGGRMVGSAGTGVKRVVYPRYRCERRARGAVEGYVGPAECSKTVSVRVLDQAVADQIEPLLAMASGDPQLQAALRRAWKQLQAEHAPDASVRAQIGQLERVAEKARQRLRNANLLLVDGTMSREDYADTKALVEHDLNGAEREIVRLRGTTVTTQPLPDIGTVLAELGGWSAAWRSGTVAARRDVLAALVERITPVRVGHGKYSAEIGWSALGQALLDATGTVQAAS